MNRVNRCLPFASVQRNVATIILLVVTSAVARKDSPIDLTIVGAIKYADGLGRLPIGLTDILKDDLHINFKRTPIGDYRFEDVAQTTAEILKKAYAQAGHVALLTFPLWYKFGDMHTAVPEDSFIKIAYSMLETTAIPKKWVSILNEKFDAVAVPDIFYEAVYRNAGVNIPIFVLPHGIYIDHLLKEPMKSNANKVFTFGQTAAFNNRKNQALLLTAFHAEFRNDPNVRLKLHGCWGEKAYKESLLDLIKREGMSTVECIEKLFTEKENTEFYKSLDCFVLLSKGEGFSVTPREALALGIPCILSNNTAHKTICATGLVYGVPSNIEEKADYRFYFGNEDCGNNFACTIADARKALREVYTNYREYLARARQARPWVETYSWKSVKAKFLNLIKPKKVVLGERNVVTDDYLMTTSKKLFAKYKELQK